MSDKIQIRRSQIVKENRGWVTYKTKDGEKKARKSKLEILEGSMANRRVGDRRFDCRRYVPNTRQSVNGNYTFDNGDELAQQLRDANLEQVYAIAAKDLNETVRTLKTRYGHLNPGMQRMCLGNRIRGERGITVEADEE